MEWRDIIDNDPHWRALSDAQTQTNTASNNNATVWQQQHPTGIPSVWQQYTTGMPTIAPSVSDRYRDMIRSRMQWPYSTSTVFSNTFGIGRFSFLDCVPIEGCRVVVFAVIGGKDVVLYDDESIFPSDTLITQLRLLEG